MINEFLQNGSILSTDSNRLLIGWGKREWTQNPTLSKSPQFYFPDFFLKYKKPWFFHTYYKEISLTDLIQCLEFSKQDVSVEWAKPDFDFFKTSFSDLQKQFAQSQLQKAVPYVFHNASYQMNADSIQSSLYHLLQQDGSFVYGYWNENEGMLGATPELLFSLGADGYLQTAAVAGTVSKDQQNTMLHDEKIMMEHQLVIDGIRTSLSSYGMVNVGDTEVLELSSLSHLKTPIEMHSVHVRSIEELVGKLHPTPALGAYPKDSAMQWLKKYNEIVPRGRYGAPVGLLFDGAFISHVAIRNIQWEGDQVSLGVGCGVVAQSCLDDEIQELALKFSATREMMRL